MVKVNRLKLAKWKGILKAILEHGDLPNWITQALQNILDDVQAIQQEEQGEWDELERNEIWL